MSYFPVGFVRSTRGGLIKGELPRAVGFTPEEEQKLLDTQDEILRRQKEEESRRRWTMAFAVGGAIFAALRLGIIAFPMVKKRRSMGQLPGV